jgi:uncharacterized protein (DUF305 family)
MMRNTTPLRCRAGSWLVLAVLLLGATVPALAQDKGRVGRDYDPARDDDGPLLVTWWDISSRATAEAGIAADRRYVDGMRPHHAGALTLSRQYLKDPEARNPLLRDLARNILAGQAFEIALLDKVAEQLDQPLRDLLGGWVMRPVGVEGLGPETRFMGIPGPTPLGLLNRNAPISEADLRFAKSMRIHHAAAVRMAETYNAGNNARNNFLRLLNVEIIAEQTQQIALMDGVMAQYPGGADAIHVDPAKIPGMQHMQHGSGGAGTANGHAGHH